MNNLQIKDQGLVSIVVPIYNAQKWLGYCLNAIMGQTYPFFEAILVNDGSTDISLEICEQYAALDKRFQVISISNSGVSNARNVGVSASNGRWLTFVDSDDIPDKRLLECLVENAGENDTDLVISSAQIVDFSEQKNLDTKLCSDWLTPKKCRLSHAEFSSKLMQLIWHTSLLESPWGKLYSLPLWKTLHLKFPVELSLGEDFVTNLDYYSACNSVVFVNEVLYYYNNSDNSDSLTHRYRPNLFENKMRLMEILGDHLGDIDTLPPVERTCYYNYVASTGLKCLNTVISSKQLSAQEELDSVKQIISFPLFITSCMKADYIDAEFKDTIKYVEKGDAQAVLRQIKRLEKLAANTSVIGRHTRSFVTRAKKIVKRSLQEVLKPIQRTTRFAHRLQTEELLNSQNYLYKHQLELLNEINASIQQIAVIAQRQADLESQFKLHISDKNSDHWDSRFGYDSLIANLQLNAVEQVVPGNRSRLEKLRDSHVGERCFVIGNGPSLRAEDLDKLKKHGFFCFAAKRIHLIFDQTDWRPNVWGASDLGYIQEFGSEINRLTGFTKLVPCQSIINMGCKIDDAIYFPFIQMERTPAWFNADVTRGVHFWGTITCKLINFAVYMGFREIYLLGVDNHWPVKKNEQGELVMDDEQKTNFSSDYYRKGTDGSGYNRLIGWGQQNFLHSIQYINQSYKAVNWHCQQLGVKIYNATRGGDLDTFERVDIDTII